MTTGKKQIPYNKEWKIRIADSGDVFTTGSTHRAAEYLVEIDYRKHRAWNPEMGNVVNQDNANVSNFNKKFAGLGFLGAKKPA